MAFPTTQHGGPARGCHDRRGWLPRGHSTTSSSGEHGQMVAAREDRESFLARLGLSLAETARQLGPPRRELRRRSRERSDHQSTESTTSRITGLPNVRPSDISEAKPKVPRTE